LARLLFAGYIGCGNLGDDAIMLGLAHQLGNDYEITVLSGSPSDTQRNYGFDAVPRRDMKAVADAIGKCDALVFPGGSIFQDATSVMSVKYYSDLVSAAKKAGKKVLLLGQGVGPLTSFFGKRMAAGAFNSADVISVRDPQSMQALKDLGVKKAPRVAADGAFLLPTPREEAEEMSFGVGGMKTVAIAPRPLDKKADVSTLFGEFCRLLYQSGAMPVLLEMDREEDGPLIEEIHKKQGGRIPQIRKLQTPMQVQQRIRRMDAVVALRLHAGILAATVGVPPFMISYDPKVSAFARQLEIGGGLPLEGLTAQRMFESYQGFMKDRDRNIGILEKKREELAKQAEINVELVRQFVPTKVAR
jgi:polysaccharide pyruvyl transferase CsaB